MAERSETRELSVWEPFRELTRVEDLMDRFFGRRMRLFDLPLYSLYRPLIEESRGIAPVEILNRDGQRVIRMEVPGVEMKDIDISVSDGQLTIKGEKKLEKEVKEEELYCSERSYGSFRRTISLPHDLDTSKISAEYTNGVLEIILPLAEEKAAQKIEVKTK